MTKAKISSAAILQDPDFIDLTRRKDAISMVLTVIEFVLYFGFILLVAYNKEFMTSMITTNVTTGIVIAIGTIVGSWVLTGVYIWWANTTYDTMVSRMKEKIGG